MDGSLDETRSASRNNARKDRFGQPSNAKGRLDALEAARTIEREQFERQGLINIGQTQLDDAVDMRGTCEMMCCEYEQAKRVFTLNVNPLERDEEGNADPERMVAIYTRSDAGAGVGEAMKLPSDLRTPKALVRSLDYLVSRVMRIPSSYSNKPPSARRSLGNTAGFIRDRTRAIRKEFSLQSSWGHREAIDCLERIARYHILSLRELQEESGGNTDMHIDNAELGRCFTSLRQHYDDMRETTREEMPCPNEPELRAYMLIYDLNLKSIAISTSELPLPIFSHPLVTLAFQIRQAAQRNFDSQKEGSKQNAELGMNLVTRVVKLLRRPDCPFLLSCMVEIRLREVRRSALRALCQLYLPLRSSPLVMRDGEVVEKRMFGLKAFEVLMGCDPAEMEESAWDDVDVAQDKDEGVRIAKRFGLEPFPTDGEAEGILVHKAVPFDDNEDAPYTRRWAAVTARRQGLDFADIVDGRAGVNVTSALPTDNIAFPTLLAPLPNLASHGFHPRHQAASLAAAKAITPSAPQPIPSFFAPPSNAPKQGNPIAAAPIPTAPAGTKAPQLSFSFGPSSAASLPPTHAASTIPAFSFGPKAPVTAVTAAPNPPAIVPATSKPMFSFGTTAPSAVATTSAPAAGSTPSFFSAPPAPSASETSVTLSKDSNLAPAPSLVPPIIEVDLPAKPAAPQISSTDRLIAAASIRTALLESVLSTVIQRSEATLSFVVDQEGGRRGYLAAQRAREDGANYIAHQVYKEQLANIVEDIAEEALLEEIKQRLFTRNAGRRWRSNARSKAQQRSTKRKDEEETFARLSRMGIGGSIRATIVEDSQDGSYTPRTGPVLLPRSTNGYAHSFTGTVTSSTGGKAKRSSNAMTWEFPPDLAVLFGVFEDVQPTPLSASQSQQKQTPSSKGSLESVEQSPASNSTASSRGTKRDRTSLDHSALEEIGVNGHDGALGEAGEVEEKRESRAVKSARLEEAIRAANACMTF